MLLLVRGSTDTLVSEYGSVDRRGGGGVALEGPEDH